jgi:hypothetical protein
MLKNAGYGFAKTYPKGKLSLENIRLSYDPKMHYSTIELSIPPALAKRLPIPGGIDSHPAIAMCFGNKNECKTLYFIGIDGPYRSKLIRLLYTKIVSFTSHVVHISPGAWGIADLPKTIEGVIEFAHSMVMDVPLPEWIFQMLDMLNENVQVQASISVSYLRVRKYHLPLLATMHSLKIFTAPSYYYRFHQAVNLPSNWVALGDSIMRINPVFGCVLICPLIAGVS